MTSKRGLSRIIKFFVTVKMIYDDINKKYKNYKYIPIGHMMWVNYGIKRKNKLNGIIYNILNLLNNFFCRLYHIKNIMCFISHYYCVIIHRIIFS